VFLGVVLGEESEFDVRFRVKCAYQDFVNFYQEYINELVPKTMPFKKIGKKLVKKHELKQLLKNWKKHTKTTPTAPIIESSPAAGNSPSSQP
jgi:hypothetical protein